MTLTYPNLKNTQILYDVAGFVTNDNKTWNFILIEGGNKSVEVLFVEEIRPLWFTVAVDDIIDGRIKRIIYKRDILNSSYIVAQLNKDGEWNLQALSLDIRFDDQCIYDLTSLYCFGKSDDNDDGNRTKISRINFCGFNEICVQKGVSFSSEIVGENFNQIFDYNSCSTMIRFKDKKNIAHSRNLYNLQNSIDDDDAAKLDVNNSTFMCYNYTTFNFSSSFSMTTDIVASSCSLSLQYRFRQPYNLTTDISCPKNNDFQACLDKNASNKTLFQVLFYSVISVFAIYILVNIIFLLLMFYRRRKMIQKLSKCFKALEDIEKSEERNSEKKQTTVYSNKETENKSGEKFLQTARQPRIFMNESLITADLPSSRKQMEETTGGKNDS